MGKKYSIIYIDPPWTYSRQWNKDPKNGGITYPVMSMNDLKSLPIQDITDKNAALFLWCCSPKLREGLELIKAYEFDFKTVGFNWIKVSKDGSPRCGLGHYTRSSSELCLLAIKGSMKRLDNNINQTLHEPIRGHSAKPLIVRDKIIQLFGNLPMIELFARERDPRFDTVGNEISQMDIKQELKMIIDGTWRQS
jgi:N6-adenosine-specific RNA methylase IME4